MYGSREFCAYIKRISLVSGECWIVRLLTPCYYRHLACALQVKNVGLCACVLHVTIGIWHVNTSEEWWIMRLRTPRYYMHLACALQVKKGDRKPEFSSKHSHEIGP